MPKEFFKRLFFFHWKGENKRMQENKKLKMTCNGELQIVKRSIEDLEFEIRSEC